MQELFKTVIITDKLREVRTIADKKLRLILLILLFTLLASTLAYVYIFGDVWDLLNILNGKGYQVSYADGIFGRKTGLSPDGIVGLQTFKALKKGSSTPANPPSSSANKSLAAILKEKGINGPIPNLKIVVDKSEYLLTLYSGSTLLKSYHVALGDSGLGDKVRSGDNKTPEGTFYISERSVLTPPDQYLGTRWMRISYPNIEDAQRGLNSGLIDQAAYNQIVGAINNGQIPPQNTALGGGVGIHGGSNWKANWGDAWTWGCVALSNSDVNEIFDYIGVGTKLVIQY